MGMRGLGDTSVPEESEYRARPGVRQPAPTITIDTSAIAASYGEASNFLSYFQRPRSSSIERRPLLSFESRPTSPCDISSPAFRGNDKLLETQNLLTIPSTSSRRSSLDHAHSVSSYEGETLFSTPTLSDYDGFHGGSSEAISSHGPGNDDPFKGDPVEERETQVEDNPFAFSSRQLSRLFNPKNLKAFRALGGPQGLAIGLRTDLSSGLSLDETALEGTVDLDIVTSPINSNFLHKGYPSYAATMRSTTSPSTHHISSGRYVDRKRIFSTNRLPHRKSKNLLQIMWMTFNDKVLIILTTVAAISLILGLYQDFGQSEGYGGPKVRWVEGVTIMVAVAIVVIVGSLNDYQKEQQFSKLNRKVSNPTSALKAAKSYDRRKIAWSKLYGQESLYRFQFMTFLLEMYCILNLVIWSLQMECSLLVTTSDAMNPLSTANLIRKRKLQDTRLWPQSKWRQAWINLMRLILSSFQAARCWKGLAHTWLPV
jgi:Ca2+-transporting ATPase